MKANSGQTGILLVGGTDPSGGAGITRDCSVVAGLGATGFPVVSAVTAQNSSGLTCCVPVADECFAKEMDCVVSEFPVGAIKIGLLAGQPQADAVTNYAEQATVPLVWDPVLSTCAWYPKWTFIWMDPAA